jgi:hypothetical protein
MLLSSREAHQQQQQLPLFRNAAEAVDDGDDDGDDGDRAAKRAKI